MIAGGNLLSGCLTCGSPDQVNLEGTLSGLVGSGLVMQTNSSSPGFTIAGGGESTTNKNISSPNTLFVALVMLFLASASAFAADEDVPPLSPGMRVRILAPELSPSKVMGTVNRVNDDSVTLDVPGRSEPVSISREKIARLDVSDGPRSAVSMRQSAVLSAPPSGQRAARGRTAAGRVTLSAPARSPPFAHFSVAASAQSLESRYRPVSAGKKCR